MKAIVLTCDKYHGITDHMIHKYMKIWPDNPFVFRIPYQKHPAYLEEKYKQRVELLKTDHKIKQTLLRLIEDLADDEWIYWCIDDRYPVSMKVEDVSTIYDWITNSPIDDLSGIMFSSFPKMMHVRNIMSEKNSICDNLGRKYYRRRNYAMIWMHQFLRVKVIRRLFNEFPDEFDHAKQMDYFKKDMILPEEHKLYMYSKSIAEYGESTHRGKMTQNCVDSLRKLGMEIPLEFEVNDRQIFIRKNTFFLTNVRYKIEQIGYFLFSLFFSRNDEAGLDKKITGK